MKALVIGRSAYNVTCEVNAFPEENTQNVFSNGVDSIGGCACNIAYALGKYKVDTYLGSTLGDDTYGSFVKKELEKVGVHTEYMETAYEKRTAISLILSGKENKSRTIYTLEKEPLLLKKTEFQVEPDIVIVDGYDYGASLSALNRFSKKITMIDAGTYTKEVVELCKYCQYIVASKEFAEKYTGQQINFENPQSLVYVFSSLMNKLPNKEIVITIGDRGALYMTNGQIKVMPGLQNNVVDTTGCGDIFHAAFGYALLKGYDIEKTVTFANIAAGLSINKMGFINSVASLDEIMVYFRQKYGDDPKVEIAPQIQSQVQMPAATPTAEANAQPAAQPSVQQNVQQPMQQPVVPTIQNADAGQSSIQ